MPPLDIPVYISLKNANDLLCRIRKLICTKPCASTKFYTTISMILFIKYGLFLYLFLQHEYVLQIYLHHETHNCIGYSHLYLCSILHMPTNMDTSNISDFTQICATNINDIKAYPKIPISIMNTFKMKNQKSIYMIGINTCNLDCNFDAYLIPQVTQQFYTFCNIRVIRK